MPRRRISVDESKIVKKSEQPHVEPIPEPVTEPITETPIESVQENLNVPSNADSKASRTPIETQNQMDSIIPHMDQKEVYTTHESALAAAAAEISAGLRRTPFRENSATTTSPSVVYKAGKGSIQPYQPKVITHLDALRETWSRNEADIVRSEIEVEVHKRLLAVKEDPILRSRLSTFEQNLTQLQLRRDVLQEMIQEAEDNS